MIGGLELKKTKIGRAPRKAAPQAPPQAAHFNLKIEPLETAKTKIPQRPLMKADIIPRHPSSCLFNGSSGSGKSTLLLNLLTRKNMLGGYFNDIYLFSPTGGSDDLFKHLKIKKSNIITDIEPARLQSILDKQERTIEEKGIEKARRVLIIFEDIQGNAQFMRSKPFLRSFIANRHFGISTWLCGQSFTKTPRACRLQANNIFYFPGSGSEKQLICDEFAPPNMSKREFEELLNYATGEKYSFLHINMRVHPETRYRRNLDEVLALGGAQDYGS